jgi:carbon monoxide dehydrogenase subunit G
MAQSVLTLVVAVALVLAPVGAAAAAVGDDVVVQVSRDGNSFDVSAELAVAATVDEVWEVLTDFDRMATILSNVDQSRIVNRDGDRFEVVQKSHGSAGPIQLSLDSVRHLELVPKREIRSRLIKGDLKSSEFTTRVVPQGDVTRVTVNGKFVAGFLSGAVITPEAVQAQTRQQYQELREEILRRKRKEPTPPCLIAKNCVR